MYKWAAISTLGASALIGLISVFQSNERWAVDPWFFPLIAALILQIVQYKL